MSIFNHAHVIGRLTSKAEIRENADGSHKVFLNVAVPRGYVEGEGDERKRPVDYLRFTKFLPEGFNLSVYENLTVGERIAIDYEVRQNRWVTEDGKSMSRDEKVIERFERLETKAAIEARAAAKAAEADVEGEPMPVDDEIEVVEEVAE